MVRHADSLAAAGEPVSRPDLVDEAIILKPNFRIHYTLSNSAPPYDATTVEWAQNVAEYAEYARGEIINRGWLAPPSDGTYGGDDKYDIYIVNTQH